MAEMQEISKQADFHEITSSVAKSFENISLIFGP